MKLIPSLTWAVLALRSYGVLGEASVYIQDNVVSMGLPKVPSISPNAARLLFAQRLGLSQYHEVGDADEATLVVLNAYGGYQPSLFADEEKQDFDRLLFIIEGVEFPEDLMEHEQSSITIANPPTTAQNAKLAQDLLEQALHAGSGKTMSHIKHNLSLQGLTRSDGHRYTHALTTLKTILKTYAHQMPTATRTIVLMPPRSANAKPHFSPYGKYTMPLLRRDAQPLQHESPLEEFPSASKPTLLQDPSDPSSSSTSTPLPLPPGIPKICHPTLPTAQTSTNNCSSHGTVYLRAAGAHGNPDCWACKCSSTAITTTDASGNKRTKTTFWGGAACQKKDVSAQFWLLAGVTVGVVAVVGYGVGLLVSVGGETLPGVLGAGVGGARAQK